ncbi:MAG: hypothetical protein U0S50_05065 [Sphingopyxis sp.]|uniref:hypothetical protein n=1 Tax=Sphingopyxis sp. TaxID=1908224 RepID=UPI002ABBF8A6|nr:hypothetical protein [Sphingopyxis sp.]MDZ3831173.1 hypothetical protein [Sphingopyxis sp.]
MSDPLDMTGMWTGSYRYPSPWEPPREFVAVISEQRGALSGSTTEKSDLLPGADERAAIRGTRTDTAVAFGKYYDGDGAYAHFVAYEGTLTPDGRRVEGRWSIDGFSGSFVMTRPALAAIDAEAESHERAEMTFSA